VPTVEHRSKLPIFVAVLSALFLAGGLFALFLVAGARPVVASHLSVDDESTAELDERVLRGSMASARRNETIHYPRALQQARREVRQRWPAPYHWAPFVLIGPPE
jgi:CHAT domain-containing protein